MSYPSRYGVSEVPVSQKMSSPEDWRAEMGESGYHFRTDPDMDTRTHKREIGIPLMDSELIKRKTLRGEVMMDKESVGGGINEVEEMSTSSISSYRVNHLNKEELQQCVRDLIETKLEEDGNESEEALKKIIYQTCLNWLRLRRREKWLITSLGIPKKLKWMLRINSLM